MKSEKNKIILYWFDKVIIFVKNDTEKKGLSGFIENMLNIKRPWTNGSSRIIENDKFIFPT